MSLLFQASAATNTDFMLMMMADRRQTRETSVPLLSSFLCFRCDDDDDDDRTFFSAVCLCALIRLTECVCRAEPGDEKSSGHRSNRRNKKKVRERKNNCGCINNGQMGVEYVHISCRMGHATHAGWVMSNRFSKARNELHANRPHIYCTICMCTYVLQLPKSVQEKKPHFSAVVSCFPTKTLFFCFPVFTIKEKMPPSTSENERRL